MKQNTLRLSTFALGTIAALALSLSSITASAAPTVAGCKAGDFVDGTSNNEINTAGKSYSPRCLRVKIGASVTIQASGHHPLAAMTDIGGASNPFSSSVELINAQTRIMNKPGVYGYFCTNHGDASGRGMAGAILVVQ